jgi:membrane protein DedA with SNARE-associated domain
LLLLVTIFTGLGYLLGNRIEAGSWQTETTISVVLLSLWGIYTALLLYNDL